MNHIVKAILPHIENFDTKKYSATGNIIDFYENIEHNQAHTKLIASTQLGDNAFGEYSFWFNDDIVEPIEIKYCGYPLKIIK